MRSLNLSSELGLHVEKSNGLTATHDLTRWHEKKNLTTDGVENQNGLSKKQLNKH